MHSSPDEHGGPDRASPVVSSPVSAGKARPSSSAASGEARLSPPIFVGGTGRSGTTILGRLLGKQRDYTVIPVEARFHCSPDGLPGVLDGTLTPQDFARRVDELWWVAKLAEFVERDAFDAALARFLELAPEDALAAGRGLMEDLFGGYARSRDRGGWVEMTPINAVWGAPYLARLFPELRFLNVIRDGRDVASSLIAVGWQADVREALRWWEERMRRGHEQCQSLAPGALLTVRFERLLRDDRDGCLQELHNFMGWDEDPRVRGFFTRRMPPEEAHIGRWKTHFHGREREFVATEYAAILERLQDAGVPTP
jgi:hypothetical protein